MKLRILAILLLIATAVSAQKKKIIFPPPVLGMDVPDFMAFCQVPSHKNERVYTRFYYAGADEYWSVYAPEWKSCTTTTAELDTSDLSETRPEFIQMFRKVHDNYWSYYLIIDAIGVYDDSNKAGYGHLGSNKANFKVEYIVNVQIVNKKK